MLRSLLLLWVGVCLSMLMGPHAMAQSIISGDIAGTVTDPSGGAVPNASVALINVNTNATQKTVTSGQGTYRFAFLPPGTYSVTVSIAGFQTTKETGIVVAAGQPTSADIRLKVAVETQVVEVTGASNAVQTENADVATTFRTDMLQNLPNPGGDITYFAQTAPGVVMNTQAGYGNFVADGMPATSNLFTLNGANDNDPFFGINNSGASNLLLGSNDIAEANVINNAYSGQYGQYAGSQIAYISKSGTNQFHGDAIYMWNGRALNANQFFSNEVGQPTPFNNFNQWQTGVQGPIWKNHTFFDVDYEGVHNLLPTASALTLIPSPQFQTATLANLATNGNAAEIPFYKQVFAIYNNAPGAGGAIPVANNGGCQDFTGLPAGVPCALQFRTTPGNINTEYQWATRVDHVFNDKDTGYLRLWRDNGFQPTFTSPFGQTFNEQSNQPQMEGQVAETHAFGPNMVNEFKGSGLFYSAVFVPSDPTGALAALPTFVGFSGNAFSPVGAWGEPPFPPGFFFPQGRRVFQYQVLDDFSYIHGRHTFRVGFSWLHDTITDLDFQALAGPINGAIDTSLSDFFNGGGTSTSLSQAFPSSAEQGIRFNTYGGYVADDWKVRDGLTVSLNLRMESYASPTCDTNCFSRLNGAFTGAPNPNAASTPYNQFILAGQQDAYPNTQALVWEPRVGIAWKPFHSDNTVIRTGAGVFADELPGGLTEIAAFNAPGLNAFTIGNGALAPGAPGSLFTTAARANQTLLAQFNSGGSFNSISQTVPGFAAPNFSSFPDRFFQPTYYKWNFEIEQALGGKMVLTVNYSGMHGTHIPVGDQGLNAYCPPSVCPNGFAGLPTAPANAALGTVTQYLSAGTSSYNGITVSLQRRLSAGLTFNVNYTYSHALDDVSNGGVVNEPFGILVTDPSITSPQNPFNIRGNYGNADYDVRQYLSANFVFSDMFRHAGFHWGPNLLFGGWNLSGNWFWRTGLPFTVVDTSAESALFGLNDSGPIFASPVTNVSRTCTSAVNSPCLSASQFAPAANGAPSGFGTMGRNSIYGPHFFDVDLALMKEINITERVKLSFGAQAYNLFNHTNFDQPVNDISNALFGSSVAAVGPPTSLLGSFVGAGSSPRFLEIKGVVRF
ncbi:MAG TPA: carboxypeptidase-like regulatory domain-containing protein [Bryobacteraceae bacterium]|nr:carboxypeptidase-like regulatory domain-containing protein [Bryobacteraceae bacterium]